ncbi:hypothetical protein IAT38_005773 [Cryptococcus sp. DSM 104549]
MLYSVHCFSLSQEHSGTPAQPGLTTSMKQSPIASRPSPARPAPAGRARGPQPAGAGPRRSLVNPPPVVHPTPSPARQRESVLRTTPRRNARTPVPLGKISPQRAGGTPAPAARVATRTPQPQPHAPSPRTPQAPHTPDPQPNPTSLPQWAAHTPIVTHDGDLGANGGFPEIVSQRTGVWEPDDDEEEDWELRTETVHQVDMYDDSPLAIMQANHLRQLTHYKNLLVRSQSASSSSIHNMHMQLQDLERAYKLLEREYHGLAAVHAECGERRAEQEREKGLVKRAVEGMKEEGLGGVVRGMGKDERVKLLGVIAEACHPSDINTQIAILEKYRRSRYDILNRLPEPLVLRILSLLDVKDILNLRVVAKSYTTLTENEDLWRTLCRQLEWRDWDGQAGLLQLQDPPERGWEDMYKSLWRREKNWNSGMAQKVFRLKGHTNYVTSLRLRGDVLISGSYDETIRLWHLPPLQTLSPQTPSPLILPAKSVSCLDYHAQAGVFVAGYHDVGRVQVWRRKGAGEEWGVVHTLSGHLHGIRAVAINDTYLVSAGADKALVVWSWHTGEKIVRFGQQTNICVGIQLVGDWIVAVTVDGVVKTFSIRRRAMVAQFKIAELGRGKTGEGGIGAEVRGKLREVGGGVGGSGMLNWFEGQGRWMTVATREVIIRLAWDEIEEDVLPVPPHPQTHPSSPTTALSVASPRTRTSITLSARSTRSAQPSPSTTPIRQRQLSNTPLRKTPLKSPSVSSHGTTPATPSPLRRKGEGPEVLGRAGSPAAMGKAAGASSKRQSLGKKLFPVPSPLSIPEDGTLSSRLSQPSTPTPTASTTPAAAGSTPPRRTRIIPLLTKPPRVLEVINAPDVEKGAIDARRTRVVTSTRFAARTGADRHLYVGAPKRRHPDDKSEGALTASQTEMIPITGAWAAKAQELSLQTPEKNPMSLVLDREKFVYGCTDGTIVVVGFLGYEYGLPRQDQVGDE